MNLILCLFCHDGTIALGNVINKNSNLHYTITSHVQADNFEFAVQNKSLEFVHPEDIG